MAVTINVVKLVSFIYFQVPDGEILDFPDWNVSWKKNGRLKNPRNIAPRKI